MGLSGRKVKQRIPQDPRNLSWADDAARFGSNYLSKFGWDASKGLGAGGDGRTSHIKVSHKLDMLGIGAAHQKDPDGIAWKQNKDFENLLKRLNETIAEQTPVESENEEEVAGQDAHVDKGEKKKKRKHKDTGEDGSDHKKKKRKEGKDAEANQQTTMVVESMELHKVEEKIVDIEPKKPAVPRHRAHRARAIAAKNISSKSAAHISEILGVAPTPTSLSASLSSEFQQGKLTSPADTDDLEIEKITTSTKSLADYFKEKLASKFSGSTTPTTPTSGSRADQDSSYDAPRIGLGASRVRLEMHSETSRAEEETQRMGLSKFSSLMSSSFLASTSSIVPHAVVKMEDFVEPLVKGESDSARKKDAKKRERKERKKQDEEEERGDVIEQSLGAGEKMGRKDKKKKDKKGKDTVVETNGEEPTVKAEKKKKEKKLKAEGSSMGVESDEEKDKEDIGLESRKKKKHKTIMPVGEDVKKLRKEKYRTTSEDS